MRTVILTLVGVVAIAGIMVGLALSRPRDAMSPSGAGAPSALETPSAYETPSPRESHRVDPADYPEAGATPDDSMVNGIPAIVPLPDVPEGEPAITVEAVIDYVNAHPMRHWTSDTELPVIASVEFMTAGEVKARMEDGRGITGLPDDALVCVVTLSGSFEVWGLPDHGETKTPAYTSDIAHMIFDARTGNLRMNTVGPWGYQGS